MNQLFSIIKYHFRNAKLLVLGLAIAVLVLGGESVLKQGPDAVSAAVEPAPQSLVSNYNGNTNHVVISAVVS